MSSLPDRSLGRRPDGELGSVARARRARNLRRVGLVVLALVVVAAASGMFGPRERTTSAGSDSVRLAVTHPTVVRPGLEIDLRLDLGVTAPTDRIVVLMSQALFDEFGIDRVTPEPSEQSAIGDDVRLVFDIEPGPAGVLFAGRLPTQAPVGSHEFRVQAGPDGSDLVRVDLKVWVLP